LLKLMVAGVVRASRRRRVGRTRVGDMAESFRAAGRVVIDAGAKGT
jgi:hypothetical protein